MTSPIEMMIDRACGMDNSRPGTRECITLRCPICKRAQSARRDKTDPPRTAIVQVLCPKCDDGGGFPEVLYFDAAGSQLSIE